MGIGQRRADRLDDLREFVRCQRAARHARFERLPFDELHHQERAFLVFRIIVNGDNVRVIEFCHQARLALEARREVWVFAESGMQHLERHVAVERGVVSLVDRGHAALSQLLDDAVGTDIFSDIEGHGLSLSKVSPIIHAESVDRYTGRQVEPVYLSTCVPVYSTDPAMPPRQAIPCLRGIPTRRRRRWRRASSVWRRPPA